MRQGGSYIRRGDTVERVACTADLADVAAKKHAADGVPGELTDAHESPHQAGIKAPTRKGGKTISDTSEE